MEKCDRCDSSIDIDKDAAICFNSADEQIYLCEPCIEDIKTDFFSKVKEGTLDVASDNY
jgi:hypothetical protein